MLRVLIISLSFIFPILSSACEKCNKPSPSLAYKQANLVVIAKQIGPLPERGPTGKPRVLNNKTKIKIIKVIKGPNSLLNTSLEIRAHYGICNYGLILKDRKEYLIFLKKESSKSPYQTLTCKAQEIPVRNDKIDINGKKIKIDNLDKYFKSISK